MFPRISDIKETLGLIAGAAVAPIFGVGSALRGGRFFHPRGLCFHAIVKPSKVVPPDYAKLANGLSGDALVRMSAGLWREEKRLLPDLLGFSIRFKAWPPLEIPTDEAQDLLTVSARSPWTLGLDSLTTNQGDFLLNTYYGLSPFEVEGKSNIDIRIVPSAKTSQGEDRYEKISNAIATGGVDFRLEIREPKAEWISVADIHLQQAVKVDQTLLQFWPFRSGQGIKPQGFIHNLRRVPYIASRFGRSSVNQHRVGRLEAKPEVPKGAKSASVIEMTSTRSRVSAQRSRGSRAKDRSKEPQAPIV